jgi:hypothetical protein
MPGKEKNRGVTMKKTYSIIILLLICLNCSACIPEFINPLSEPQDSTIDRNLLGTWYTKSKGENVYIHFEIDKVNSNMLNTELRSINNKEQKTEITLFTLFTTEINNKRYMNIKEQKEGKLSDYYSIIRYEIKDNKIKIYTINEAKLEKAISNNLILGSSRKGKLFYQVQITDIGLNTLKLLESDNIFVYLAEFEKVK